MTHGYSDGKQKGRGHPTLHPTTMAHLQVEAPGLPADAGAHSTGPGCARTVTVAGGRAWALPSVRAGLVAQRGEEALGEAGAAPLREGWVSGSPFHMVRPPTPWPSPQLCDKGRVQCGGENPRRLGRPRSLSGSALCLSFLRNSDVSALPVLCGAQCLAQSGCPLSVITT